MNKTTQRIFVINELKKSGKISRNLCLSNYITRLGAIIFDLKQEGWDFRAEWVPYVKSDGSKDKDFVYSVATKPKERKIEIFVDSNGERKAREIFI